MTISTIFLPGFPVGLFSCWHRGILKTFLVHPPVFLLPVHLRLQLKGLLWRERTRERGNLHRLFTEIHCNQCCCQPCSQCCCQPCSQCCCQPCRNPHLFRHPCTASHILWLLYRAVISCLLPVHPGGYHHPGVHLLQPAQGLLPLLQ